LTLPPLCGIAIKIYLMFSLQSLGAAMLVESTRSKPIATGLLNMDHFSNMHLAEASAFIPLKTVL
jgi:hypothetical protein